MATGRGWKTPVLLGALTCVLSACEAEDGSRLASQSTNWGVVADYPTQRVEPEHLHYRGAFTLEATPDGASSIEGGGMNLAFRATGGSTPDDGYRGSIFVVGHVRDQLVAEFDIPEPALLAPPPNDEREKSATGEWLPVADLLQPWADVTSGLKYQTLPDGGQYRQTHLRIGGLSVRGEEIHWSLWKWYNVAGTEYPAFGVSTTHLANPRARGPYSMGPAEDLPAAWSEDRVFHPQKTAGYITEIPPYFARRIGKSMACGFSVAQGRYTTSWGPALYAYDPVPGASGQFEAIPLLYYPMRSPLDDHRATDFWRGATWIAAGDFHALLFVGNKGLGTDRYGQPRPGDCEQSKGYHCGPFRSMFLWYDPDELEDVALREKQPWDVKPYRRSIPDGSVWPTCRGDLFGCAYDPGSRLLYVLQPKAFRRGQTFFPVVHVYFVGLTDG